MIDTALARFGNRSYMRLLVLGLVWLVGCAPAEPIEVTRVVAVPMTATVGVTETAEPANTPTLTAVPSPTVEATSTPTVKVTAGPTNTPSPSTTPSQTPSVTPHLPMVEGQLPAVGHDLLFLADGSLKRWSHERGQVEVLLTPEATNREVVDGPVDQINRFQLSGDGQWVLATQLMGGDSFKQRFIIYRLDSGERRVLGEDVRYLRN